MLRTVQNRVKHRQIRPQGILLQTLTMWVDTFNKMLRSSFMHFMKHKSQYINCYYLCATRWILDLGMTRECTSKTSPSLVTGTTFSMLAGGMHRSLSSGNRSQSSIFGQGNPNADITGAQPFLTLSHRDLQGCIGSSKSSKHTGAKREHRNFLVSGWHCFWTRGIQDEACCRTSFMVSCPSRFGRRMSVYSISWHRRRFAGIGLQLFFL